MKKIILLLFIALQSNHVLAQFNVYLKNGQPVCDRTGGEDGKINFYNGTPSDKPTTLVAEKEIVGNTLFANCKDETVEVGLKSKKVAAQGGRAAKAEETVKITYEIGCDDKTITFLFGSIELKKLKFNDTVFEEFTDEEPEEPNDPEVDALPKFSFIRQIAYPILPDRNDDILQNSKSSRYLIIDANPNHNKKINNSLFKPRDIKNFGKDDDFNTNFEKADALPVNGSLTIFVRDYNFHDLEKITIDITGSEYSYNFSIKDILGQLKTKDTGETPEATGEGGSKAIDPELTNDLSEVRDKFKEYDYLNLNDLYKIEEYKKKIFLFYESHFDSFNKEQIDIFSEIMNWYPPYLSITPIALTIPENDEVEIKVTIKNKNESTPNQTKVGNFKTTGGIGFNLGGMFYITNLKNNSIYTKPSETADKVKAIMNSENQSSVGLGLNSEIYFRTGYLLRPTLNMGFFIPFDEDLTPFGALGPGISIASKRVKLSFSWGLAVGKVNAIKEEYKKEEFDSTGLTNDQLAEKVWKFGNYFGFGLTYNLTTE